MSDDEKKGPTGLGSNGAIVVALFATGAYFYAQQAPLTVLRPPPMETRIEEKFHSEDVEARLWQDPFDAVARQIKKVDPEEKRECEDAWSKKASTIPLHCRSPLVDETGNPRSELAGTRIIAITAPGASYFEDSETRRRLRYAVLGGLHLEGYESRNEQHIGYFRPPDEGKYGFPAAVPFEWLDKEPTSSKSILLLWLDEDVLSDTRNPLQWISAFKTMLCGSPRSSECDALSYQVLGPYSSGILRQLVRASTEPGSTKVPEPTRSSPEHASLSAPGDLSGDAKSHNIQFFVYGASVSQVDLQISGAPGSFFYTAARDDALARAITAELARRGINPGQSPGDNGNLDAQQRVPHVALISDRDSLYGRSIIQAFSRELQCGSDSDENCRTKNQDPARWIITRTYHRGLDGMLPPTSSLGAKSKGETTESGGKDPPKLQETVKALERPFGEDQFDYLRRLAANLKTQDEDLRRAGSPGITAIGVLGNDVFDKLLVLRALKPLFPSAVFFTTDYDAALGAQEELEWTRNLIIASSYGPTLSKDLQRDIPPFRSTYQTSAFLAARLAAGEADDEKSEKLRQQIEMGLTPVRMFEIDRLGQFLALPLLNRSNDRGQEAKTDIHPDIPPLYPQVSTGFAAALFVILLLAACILSFLCYANMVFPFLRYSCCALAAILMLAALLTIGWSAFAEIATEGGKGEPIAWTQGVSIWPSIALRVVAGIMAVCLLFDAWLELQKNLAKAQSRFFDADSDISSPKNLSVVEQVAAVRRDRTLISYRLPEQTDQSEKVHVDEVWNAYVAKSALIPSAIRIAVYVIFMLTLFVSLTAIFGYPSVPSRGGLGTVYHSITIFVVPPTLALVFLVFDSTLLCLCFVDALRKHKTKWPPKTHENFQTRLKFNDPFLDEWLDLDFMAFRTKCISKLIYFPFAIFALLIMSRSTAFANFALSPPIIITQVFSFIIVFGCAMMLCFSAEKARETVHTRLTKRLIAVKAEDNSEKKVSQLETLLKLVDSLREGSFVPLSQQPPIRALLLPIGGLGWTALLDYRLLPGL